MDLPLIKTLLAQLEKIYGPWSNKEVRISLLEYLAESIHPDRIDAFYKAILRSHSVARGAPDVAAAELAVMRAEERGENLRMPTHIMDWSREKKLPPPPTEEERQGFQTYKTAAKSMGINVDEDGWFASYVMVECERKARENGHDRLPGSKRRIL